MMKNKVLLCVVLIFGLAGCSTISGVGDDNTQPPSPLVKFVPQKQIHTIWRNQVGCGADRSHLHYQTVVYQGIIYTVASSGQVTATNTMNGKTLWSCHQSYFPSSGPAVCGDYLVFNTHSGEVVALHRRDGHCLWHVSVGCQLLASPVIAGQFVLAKSVDGMLTALDIMTGQTRWQFKHPAPLIMLQADSAPAVCKGVVFVGFSDGQFFALRLQTGKLLWQQMVAMPKGMSELESLVGVNADPIIIGPLVYVVTYQGKLMALSTQTGCIIWQRDLSSYENLAWYGGLIVVTDDQGVIRGINRLNGRVLWCQDGLKYRMPTAPLITSQGVWVGDAEGYLHLLSARNGCFLARSLINSSGFFVQPVCDGTDVVIRSEGGELSKVTA